MHRTKLARFRSLLEERLDVLAGHAGETIHEVREPHPVADLNDVATEETERTFTLRLGDRDRKLVAKIREALTRIDAGTYGRCEECGAAIGEKRLAARPVTTLCIECKQDSERRELGL